MKIRYCRHYYIRNSKKLTNFLKTNKISYRIMRDEKTENCIFDLYSDDYNMMKFKYRFPWHYWSGFISLAPSSRDMEEAEWFIIRSHVEKVQLKDGNSEESFELSCPYKSYLFHKIWYRHSLQVDGLIAEHKVKWGSRHFFSESLSNKNIIFGSERTKNLLNGKWTGLDFWPVLSEKGEPLPDLYQLVFGAELPMKAFAGGKIVKCKGCKKNVYQLKEITDLQIKKSYLQDQSLVHQIKMISCGSIQNGTSEFNIVSKKFYMFCEENHMNRGMEYIPIVLCEG